MTKGQEPLLGPRAAPDGAKNPMKFVRLFPEISGGVSRRRVRSRHHSQPVLRLSRFLLAIADLLSKLLPRHGVIALAVIHSNAPGGRNQLGDDPGGHRVDWNRPIKPNHGFTEDGAAFFKIVDPL